ncbi:glycosyltransferase [Rhodococcus sp. ACPA4]|nr:glycosyltransferase [Rhodococcus sp. ACPA4]RZL27105.1 MAG: glycosyltransferase [Rhodococcus sp. (in: high G+C Gram-positive bacteria)]
MRFDGMNRDDNSGNASAADMTKEIVVQNHRSDGITILQPVMAPTPNIELWAGAIWIGQVDEWELLAAPFVALAGGHRYIRARLLVSRLNGSSAFVEVHVADGVIRSREALDLLPQTGAVASPPLPEVLVTLIICTMNRPELLREVLNSLADLDYSSYEVLVVDNDPSSGLTPPVVAEFEGIRLVGAPERGLSKARNIGLTAATHDIVAFTDDDVVIDRNWLRGIVGGFAVADDVQLVTGLVPTGEVSTAAQAYFDRRVSWSKNLVQKTYRMAAPPPADPLFPFEVGNFGTGANFAVRRSAVLALGGFDEGLGVGSPCGGGEDIDMFVRILLSGGALVYEPAARVWHRHRIDNAGLDKQMADYGLGLGAWITKLMLNPRTALMLASRSVKGLRHFGAVSKPVAGRVPLTPDLDRLPKLERWAVLRGPAALIRSRRAGLKSKPLASAGEDVRSSPIIRGPHLSGPFTHLVKKIENRFPTGEHKLAALGVVGGVSGLLAAIMGATGTLSGMLVLFFVIVGPGAAIMSFYPNQPGYVRTAAVPALGISIIVLMTLFMTTIEEYYPFSQLVIPSLVTVVLASLRVYLLVARPQMTVSIPTLRRRS